jgi:hypothetical protein
MNFDRIKQVDWTYLLACVSWGLTTGLMLYVKLRKKTESFPVLILVGIFLLYMNSTDLFKSFRIYTVASVNRRILAHSFFTSLVFGFMSGSYIDILAISLALIGVLIRPGFDFGKTGIPLIGAFFIPKKRPTIVALSLASQCFGFFTGTVLSAAMISNSSEEKRFQIPLNIFENSQLYAVPISSLVGLVGCAALSKKSSIRGKLATVCGSCFIASISRVIPFNSVSILMVPFFSIISSLFPEAVVGITTFTPQLVQMTAPKSRKISMFINVMLYHAIGSLVAGYASPVLFSEELAPYGSRRAIAQEFFFSMLVGFVSTRRPGVVPIIMGAAYLATNGQDVVHLLSAISLGSYGLSNGRLLARIIWQMVGSLVGSTLVSSFLDSEEIDFDPITSVTRTTCGQTIRQRGQ